MECEWLQEFTARIHRPDQPEKKEICWDWLPQDWMKEEQYYRYDNWQNTPVMEEGQVKKEV